MATQPTSEQLKFCEPAIFFSTGVWLDRGRMLTTYGKELANRESCRQWDTGDWLIDGEDGGVKTKVLKSKDFKRHALRITKYKSWGALKNLMTISRRVPESRRRDGREGRPFLSYSIHQEIAKKFEDEETQIRLLDLAAKGEERRVGPPEDWGSAPMSVRTLQKHIEVMQERGELPRTKADKRLKKALEGSRLLKFWVPEAACRRLDGWSFYKLGNQNQAPKMLVWCAKQYVKEHGAEVDAEVAAYYKMSSAEQTAYWNAKQLSRVESSVA